MNEKIKQEIKEIIVDLLYCDGNKSTKDIKEEHKLVDDLGADSLDLVELIMSFEEAFDVEIPDEDAPKIKTVGQIFKYAEEHSFKI